MSDFGRVCCRVVGVHRDLVTCNLRITGAFDDKLSFVFDVPDGDENTTLCWAVTAAVPVKASDLFERLRIAASHGWGAWLDAVWDAKAGKRKLTLRQNAAFPEAWEFGVQGWWAKDNNPTKLFNTMADIPPKFPARIRSEQLAPRYTSERMNTPVGPDPMVSIGVSYDPTKLVTRYDGIVEVPVDALGKVESVQFVDPRRVPANPPLSEWAEPVPLLVNHDPAVTVNVSLGLDEKAAAVPSSDAAVRKWWDETLAHRKAKPRPNPADVVPIEMKAIPVPMGANDFAETRKRVEEATKTELEKHHAGKPFDRSDIRRLTRGVLAWARGEARKKIEAEFGLPMVVGPRRCAPSECGRHVTELFVVYEKLVTVGRTFSLGYNPPALETLFGCPCGRSRTVAIDTRDAPPMGPNDDFDHDEHELAGRTPNRLMFGCLPVATRAAVQRLLAAEVLDVKACKGCGRNVMDGMAVDHMEAVHRTEKMDDRRYFRTLGCQCGTSTVLSVDIHEAQKVEGDLDGLLDIDVFTKNTADRARAAIAVTLADTGVKVAPPEDEEDDPQPFVVGG